MSNKTNYNINLDVKYFIRFDLLPNVMNSIKGLS